MINVDTFNSKLAFGSISMLLFLLNWGCASAYSGLGEAHVGQVGQLPCFSIPDTRETRNYPVLLNAVVVDMTGTATHIWIIAPKIELLKQGVKIHITPDECIVYGTTPTGMEDSGKTADGLAIGVAAQALQMGVIYTAFINAVPRDGNSPIRGYGMGFCLVKTEDGNGVRVIEIGRETPSNAYFNQCVIKSN